MTLTAAACKPPRSVVPGSRPRLEALPATVLRTVPRNIAVVLVESLYRGISKP